MTHFLKTTASIASLALAAGAEAGLLVQVEATGHVAFNDVVQIPLGLIPAGSDVTLRFTLDASSFVEGAGPDARGYLLDDSFHFILGEQSLALQTPMPVGIVPYFVIEAGPAGDGFQLATSPSASNGVPLAIAGTMGQYIGHFAAGVDGAALTSTNILDALGEYDLNDLSIQSFAITDGPLEPIGVAFEHLSIALVPSPSAVVLGAVGAMTLLRRRR